MVQHLPKPSDIAENISSVIEEEVLVFPTSLAQQQMWLLAQLEPNSPYYNDTVTLHLTGSLNITVLEQSFNEILHRHAVWRTTFVAIEGEPLQIIHPPSPFKLSVVNLQSLPSHDQESEALRLATAQAERAFDLAQAPLLRATLVRLDATHHRLYLTLHHIVYDGVSLSNVFLKELADLYEAFSNGNPSPLADLTIQYADFADWQRQWLESGVLDPQIEYWKQQLEQVPVLQLPADRPRPAVRSLRGARHSVNLPQSLTEQLKALSRQEDVTLFMTLMAAFKTLLHRYTAQDDISVATVTAGRTQPELEPLIGCFVNTIVLRTDLSGSPSFREVLQREREVTIAAYSNQDVPFQTLVERLHPERQAGQQPFFQVMLEFLPGASVEVESSLDIQLDFQAIHNGTAKFDLLLQLAEVPTGVTGGVEYNTDLFDASTIDRLINHFYTVLTGIVENPDQCIAYLPLLTLAEQQALLERHESQIASNPGCLHQQFEAQAERTPDAVAIVFQDQQLTYRELNQRANQLAHHLQTLGVGADSLVGLCIDRSLTLVVAILGILKAGGAYVPLDPASPPERLAGIVEDMNAPLLVTQSDLLQRLPDTSAQAVCLDTDWDTIAALPTTSPNCILNADALTYVIYTSGSTGKPKGVLINHYNVMRLFSSTQDWFQFSEHDVWTLFHSYAFDFSVWELWGALLHGGRLVIVPQCIGRSPDSFYQLLCREQVTVLNQTPSAFRQLMRTEELSGISDNLALRLIIFGGEALELQSLKSWFERHGDRSPQLVNMYGITETTVHVTYRPITIADLKAGSAIGKPIPDLQVHLLDQNLQLVPIGVPGEMHIGGAGLARGYLNRSELTAERFIENPFCPGTRLYKSGDLARRLPNGDIEYLGRIDNQVKIRGFRIELGDVEAAIQRHSNVGECVVVVREDIPTDKRLVAYLTPNGTLVTSELRRFLQQKLPEYMIPSAFVLLEALPLTINGKVDYRALPLPDSRPELESTFIAPQTPMEQQVALFWSAVLGVKDLGIHDDFFYLGGNSLLAAHLISYVREEFQVELPVRLLFEYPTIEGLAQTLEALQRNGVDGVSALTKTIDLKADAVLASDIYPTAPAIIGEPQQVFLTGATGFLGAFLMHELLQQTQATLYCLVRCSSPGEGTIRLQQTLQQYELWHEHYRDRLIPIPGDLSQPLLGLSPEQFNTLADRIDTIYHNGALVNFVKPYSLLKAANVLGTQEVLRLACQGQTKPVHYVSTESVFGTTGYFNRMQALSENDDIDLSEDMLYLGYSQSKWVAEKLVQIAQSRGVPVTIFRPGLILGDSQTGIANVKDYQSRIVKGCIQLGCYPDLPNKLDQFVPVDYASKAIVYLSQQARSFGQIFHLVNPQHIEFLEFFRWISDYGYSLKKVPYQEWKEQLLQQTRYSQENALYPLVPMQVEAVYQGLTLAEMYQYHPYLDCQNTLAGLAGTDIVCPSTSDELLNTYFSYFIQSGFLEAPGSK
ncbi:non-ribosomal peptide synthetase family protein [Phormidesmis sp. 146-33]